MPPRQYQVALRAAAQPHPLLAGRLVSQSSPAPAAGPLSADPLLPHRPALPLSAVPAAAPPRAGQPLLHRQVLTYRDPRPAHSGTQEPVRPTSLPSRVPHALPAPAYLPSSLPAASPPWNLSARSEHQVASSARTARPNSHVSVASTRPPPASQSLLSTCSPQHKIISPHTVAFR